MRLDEVTILKPKSYGEAPVRSRYQRSNGYDLTATAAGVLVSRLPDCKIGKGRDEPDSVLVPWALVSEPCAVSPEQPEKKK